MNSANLLFNEENRLAALRSLDILDTTPEVEFDALVRIASSVCGVPISLISLIDSDRQWFKANIGLTGLGETPRDVAFCAHAILDSTLFEVPDATQDARFADNPLVTGNPGIRFYAGAPIILSDGNRVGTLCAIDRQAKKLDENQRQILQDLAHAAAKALEGRRALHCYKQTAIDLQTSEKYLRHIYQITPAMLHSADLNGRLLEVSDMWLAKLGYCRDEVLGHLYSEYLTPKSQEYAEKVVLPEFFKTGRCDKIAYQIVTKDGAILDVLFSAVLEYEANGQPRKSVAIVEDVTQRRIVERALQQKHQRLSHIVDSTRLGTWEWNVQTGEVIFNARCAEIIGYSVEDFHLLSMRTWIDAVHPDDLKISAELLDRHFADVNVDYECEVRIRHQKGHLVWVRSHGSVMTWTNDGKPEWMFGTHEDITQHNAEKQALKEANDRVSLATDSGCIGIWDWDILTNTLAWDSWMHRLYGLDAQPDAIYYQLWLHSVHPDDRESAELALHEAVLKRGSLDTEFRIVWNDGSIHHIRSTGRVTCNESGQPVRIIGANWDVTQERRLRADLAEQHELLEVTLRSIADAVITTNNKGDITWLNPVAERMTGWQVDEAMGRPLGQVFHIVNEETRRPTENPVEVCLEKGKIVGLANHTVLISRNGDEYGIEDSAAPIRNTNGNLLGVVLVFHDVTEQRRLSGEMSYRATHDALTGLINRAEFEVRLRHILQNAHDERSHHFLLYIDLDEFKLVNDSCGHTAGDQLLQQVGKLLLSAIRERDTLARLG